ncbi:hypothetical protein GCM10009668_22110 [Nocardioides dubius]|uniref:Uncharacterized protein n=1 Tax=Nocardioides dubius TaxID=317019 RepID=A0ABN1TU85_9ACTN
MKNVIKLPELSQGTIQNKLPFRAGMAKGLQQEEERLKEGALSAAIGASDNSKRGQLDLYVGSNGFEISNSEASKHRSFDFR